VGDLVNRGPDSLKVLRLVKSLGSSAITVLGNHDLHLLAVAEGVAALHHSDTLDELLHAPDRDELLFWLRNQKLLHLESDCVLVHAGLLPGWSVNQAAILASEAEQALRGNQYVDLLAHMYGNKPDHWQNELAGYDRLRVIINALTRLRICTDDGAMGFKFKGEIKDIPPGYRAWFDVGERASSDSTIIFGHWSALGLLCQEKIIALDTGCLWGGPLSAIRLEDRELFQVMCTNAPMKKLWVK
jgi:bis(5'-nucleosyl)-tetraphosphatase (symmetrical)